MGRALPGAPASGQVPRARHLLWTMLATHGGAWSRLGDLRHRGLQRGSGRASSPRVALLLRIFRRRRQAVRVARAGMWSNPGCESLFHPYVGVMFMPAGGRNHVRHRGGRQLRCRRIRQTFQDMGYSKP